MTRGAGGTLAVLIASVVAGAGYAQAPANPPAEAAATAPAPREIDEIAAMFDSGEHERALRRLDRYVREPRPPVERAEAELIRGFALLLLEREDEARAAYAAAVAAQPDNPAVLTLQFDHARSAGSLDLGEAALDRLIDAYPDEVRAMSHRDVYPLVRSLREEKEDARADALTLRLAAIGFGNWEVRPWLALQAAQLLLARGEVEEAASLLAPTVNREILENALVRKQFSPLWASLEAQAGPHMERAETAAVLLAERRLAANPEDVVERRGLVRALREARRFEEGDRAAAVFAATPEAMRAIDEDGGWLVDDHARLLYRAGRKDEADRRYAAMRVIDIEEKPWLINMVINRVELLVKDRQYAQAEPLLTEAATLAETHGSPYAMQLIRRMKVCAARGLGREADAASLAAEMMEHADDAERATVDGLICLERWDEAEERVIALLSDPENAEFPILALQPVAPGISDPSIWTEGWAKLRARPAVASAFDAVGRDLPASMRSAEPSMAAP